MIDWAGLHVAHLSVPVRRQGDARLLETIYLDHLAWPLVVGALLGKRREEPSPY
jgi:hypothetical protein